jgi:hypothetical protein
MKRSLNPHILIFVLSVVLAFPASVNAQDGIAITEYHNKGICIPFSVEAEMQSCLRIGPVSTLDEFKASGLEYPIQWLPARAPDFSLTEMPFRYAAINADPKKEVKTYPSPEAARAAENPSGSIPAGPLRYVAYTGWIDIDGGHYLQLATTNEWVRASPADYTKFQGLVFNRTPSSDFGWLVDVGTSRTGPGLNYPASGKVYYRNNIVQVFGVEKANETEWFRIGLNEWLERRLVRRVVINQTPPNGVTVDRWIEINLYEQTIAVYQNYQLVFATMIASGVDPFFTRPGTFQIFEKHDYTNMAGAFEADRSDYYYLENVPWTMYFDGARALHAAYWRTLFGFPQSHGCVNLSPGDAHWLYDWANIGDWVYVWDPSGQTPTDPSKYTQGGA